MTDTSDIALAEAEFWAAVREEARRMLAGLGWPVLALGRVTDDSPLQVQIYGETTATTYTTKGAAYTPAVDDDVLLVFVDDQWVVHSKLEAA